MFAHYYADLDENQPNVDMSLHPWCDQCYGYHKHLDKDSYGQCMRPMAVTLYRAPYFKYPDEDWIR